MMDEAILIIGYNNTRINDVINLREKAKKLLKAETILCKPNPSEEDKIAVDAVINVGLAATSANLTIVFNALAILKKKVIAILPFSDPGTQLGALLAESFNLPGADTQKIRVALDKYFFRQQEASSPSLPPHHKTIQSRPIYTYDDLVEAYHKANSKLFLKPACEGNSRGCIAILDKSELPLAWTAVLPYIKEGVIVEECIPPGKEYSFDGINAYHWITEKETTTGQYRAEIQHIVPAPLDESAKTKIKEAGYFMSSLAGSVEGAFHNELFLLNNHHETMAVEPNLRPAGMRIWDLARLAFDDFDPWKLWLLWASGIKMPSEATLKQSCYAGIRMIQAPCDGRLCTLPTPSAQTYSTELVEVLEVRWSKKIGDKITQAIQNNGDFMGYVIARSLDYEALKSHLKVTAEALTKEINHPNE